MMSEFHNNVMFSNPFCYEIRHRKKINSKCKSEDGVNVAEHEHGRFNYMASTATLQLTTKR